MTIQKQAAYKAKQTKEKYIEEKPFTFTNMASLRLISFRLCVWFVLLFASSLNLVHGHGLQKKHVALFVFGDSLFDAGNNNYINTTFRANYWPYGETFFKYSTGRFSDGRLIPDFIGKRYSISFLISFAVKINEYGCVLIFLSVLVFYFAAEYAKLPLIPPYLQPDHNHEFTYGVNFASSGAGALAETSQGLVSLSTIFYVCCLNHL